MRIASQSADVQLQQPTVINNNVSKSETVDVSKNTSNEQSVEQTKQTNQPLDSSTMKEKLQTAVETVNEVLESTNKTSKFVLHEGLDKYYVRLIDSKTEEVIKEIPPERLLDAYYELQKLAGMIIDEKI